jgi:prevent-host-death family protein
MISISEAKKRWHVLIRQIEAGEAVTITRRGKRVAVMKPVKEFERVQGMGGSWMDRLDDWRARLPDGVEGLAEAEMNALRDREPYGSRVDFGA